MKQKTFFVVVSLLLVIALLTGCAKKNDGVNEVPQEQPDSNAQVIPEQLPTGEAANVDADLNQDAVDSDVTDLENDLRDW